MRRSILLSTAGVCAGLFAFAGQAGAVPIGPMLDHQPAPPTVYTVKAGDTLSGIAPTVHSTPADLAGWNRLPDPNLIMPGQVLRLPPAGYVGPPIVNTTPAPVEVSGSSARSFSPTRTYSPSTTSVTPSGSGLAECIVSHESGGNADIYNTGGSGAWGLAQFMPGTYAYYAAKVPDGGSYGSATASQQMSVLNYALASGGAYNWAGDSCVG